VAIPWPGSSITMPTDTLHRNPNGALFSALALTVFCWMFLFAGAGTGMSVWSMTTLQIPPQQGSTMMAVAWSPGYAVRMLTMWWVMMIAMMLPGVILSIGLGWTTIRLSTRFLVTYSLGWLGFSVLAFALQYAFEQLRLLDPMRMWSVSAELSIWLLAIVIIAQALSLAQVFPAYAKPGDNGRLTPWTFTAHCLLATSPVMLLLFVGGVMNLAWIVGLSLWAIMQKSPNGRFLAPIAAIAVCLILVVQF
jgi:predicted metal-binding membrane protein